MFLFFSFWISFSDIIKQNKNLLFYWSSFSCTKQKRSCGQIFCADCSEFWAPLPDEKLFTPVRLCGPCYHAVTTRMQVSQLQNSALFRLQQSVTTTTTTASTGVGATAASTVTAQAIVPTASQAAGTTKAWAAHVEKSMEMR